MRLRLLQARLGHRGTRGERDTLRVLLLRGLRLLHWLLHLLKWCNAGHLGFKQAFIWPDICNCLLLVRIPLTRERFVSDWRMLDLLLLLRSVPVLAIVLRKGLRRRRNLLKRLQVVVLLLRCLKLVLQRRLL